MKYEQVNMKVQTNLNKKKWRELQNLAIYLASRWHWEFILRSRQFQTESHFNYREYSWIDGKILPQLNSKLKTLQNLSWHPLATVVEVNLPSAENFSASAVRPASIFRREPASANHSTLQKFPGSVTWFTANRELSSYTCSPDYSVSGATKGSSQENY